MKLFHYQGSGKRQGLGVIAGESFLDFNRAAAVFRSKDSSFRHADAASTDALIERSAFHDGSLNEFAAWMREKSNATVLSGARLADGWSYLVPVLKPGKIIAIARNYAKHAAELGNATPEKMAFFAKLPSTMVPSGGFIHLPAWLEGRVDHEAELGVIIGRRAYNISADSALACVAGYTIVNDVSSRGLQAQAKEKGMPWTAAKNIETFCPTGPWFVTADEIPDPQSLRVQCRVNGATRQDGTTRDMIHSVARTIAELSRYFALEPGDIIPTGTPDGVGKLEGSDLVECEITGLGVLSNRVKDDRPKPALPS